VSKLPSGWVEATLEELGVTAQSGFPSGKHNAEGRGVPHLRPMNVDRLGRIDLDEVKYVEDDRDRRLQPGDVLFNNTNSPALIGKTAYFDWPGDFAFSNHMTRLRATVGLEPKYLAVRLHTMWMQGIFQRLCSHHVNQASVSAQRLLAEVALSVPPLNEQRRIVAAIEEQLSRLDAADASLGAARQRLAGLRHAALADAVSGSWPEKPLIDVVTSLRNGLFVSRPASDPPGTAIFRISAVRPLALDVNDVRYAPVAEDQVSRFLVDEGDLLFTRYSGNAELVGACARVPKLSRPTLHPDKLIRAVVDRTQVDPAFLEMACATARSRDEIRARRKTTAGQVGIAGGQLKSVPIPLPPLEEQQRIVAKVEERLSVIDAMRASIERAERRSAALRRSILERAFRGELVPQDPSDEPASVLLDRLRAERAATTLTRGRARS
jgi:type I restriction enzyme S subunit